MKTIMKIFMVAVVSVFASFAMAETVSVLPVSETCSKVLQPALKEANVTFTDLKTEAGSKKFFEVVDSSNVLNVLAACKSEPTPIFSASICTCDDGKGLGYKSVCIKDVCKK
jgi:hypothetical protein